MARLVVGGEQPRDAGAAEVSRLATGRLVAGSTYFAFRWAPEAVRSARAILRETSAFLNADSGAVRTDAAAETPEE